MELRDYASYDDVRAALGVSAKELSDSTLALSLYEDNLKSEMDAIGSDFIDDYDLILVEASPSKQQERMLRAGRLFCTYVVANHLAATLAIFSPKDIGDGKASFSRQGENPFADAIRQVKARYSQYKSSVADVYADLKAATSVTTTPVYMVISSPTANPITG